MRHFFKVYKDVAKESAKNNSGFNDAEMYVLKQMARSKALGLFVRGIIELIIGAAVSIASYNNAASKSNGGVYYIFYGLIVAGGWRALKGLYYMINPVALINKAKRA